MEKLNIYWHPNCSTCKKAVKFLKEKNIDHALIDLREKAPSKTAITSMMKNNYTETPKKMFNTSGKVYREKGLKDKIADMSQKDMQNELAKDGLLIKRPFVLLKNGKGCVGFKEDEWKKLLKN